MTKKVISILLVVGVMGSVLLGLSCSGNTLAQGGATNTFIAAIKKNYSDFLGKKVKVSGFYGKPGAPYLVDDMVFFFSTELMPHRSYLVLTGNLPGKDYEYSRVTLVGTVREYDGEWPDWIADEDIVLNVDSFSSEEPGPEKRILKVSFPWSIFIDPAVGSYYSSFFSFVNLYDALVMPTADGRVIPWLAKTWYASDDGLSYTFELVKGVTFHDGTELTAEDVAFSMNRLLTIGEGYAYLFMGRVESAEVVDEYTVKINMAKPFGPFVSTLPRLHILSKECVMEHITPGPYGEFGDYGKEYLLTHDCGSGAYMVKEVMPEEHLLMEKFDEYFFGHKWNAPDEVVCIRVAETATAVRMMQTQDLEITDQWQPVSSWEALDAIEGVDIAAFYPGTVFHYMMHTRKPPTDDIHFRKAMAWAFDYEVAVATIFPGSRRSVGPVAATTPGHVGVFQYHRDLEKAHAELQLSKYYGQLHQYPVELHCIADLPEQEKLALLFQANMAEIGIEVEVVRVPWIRVVDEMASQEASPNIVGAFVTPDYPETVSILESRYHSRSAATWQQNEWLLDPDIDSMIDDALATIDWEERFRKCGKIQEKIVELCPSLFLLDQVEKHAYQAAYVDWPYANIPVEGYNMQFRNIQVFPEYR